MNRRGLLKLLPGAAILAAFGPRLTKAAQTPPWDVAVLPDVERDVRRAGVEMRMESGSWRGRNGSVSYVLFNKNILLNGRLYLRDTRYVAARIRQNPPKDGWRVFRLSREGNFWTGEPLSVPIPHSGIIVIGRNGRVNPYLTDRYVRRLAEVSRRRRARAG